MNQAVEEYGSKLTQQAHHTWQEGRYGKFIKVKNTEINFEFRTDKTTIRGESASTILQLMQRKKDIEEDQQGRLKIHKETSEKQTQTI